MSFFEYIDKHIDKANILNNMFMFPVDIKGNAILAIGNKFNEINILNILLINKYEIIPIEISLP